MSKFKPISKTKIKRMLIQRNLWSRMQSGKLTAVVENKASAKKARGGISYIISYYGENSRYICTIHRIVDKNGRVIHEHVKHALIDGTHYEVKVTKRGGKAT